MQEDIGALKEEINGTPIIVEGINDKKPLAQLGFNNIYTISGKTLVGVVEMVKAGHDQVAILTDYDEEGQRTAAELTRLFNHEGIKTLDKFRGQFRATFKVTKIEEINPDTYQRLF